MSVEPAEPPAHVSFQVFLDGIVAAIRSVFFYVLVGNYIGLGALAQRYGAQFDAAKVFAIAMVVLIIGLVMNWLIQLLDHRFTSWVN